MPIIEWSNKLETGNFEIDSQHQLFVGIIQKIHDKVEGGADKSYIEALLKELLKYAEFHFCSEENVMIEFNYPKLLEHKEEHEVVLAELRNRVFSLKYDFIDFKKLQTFLIEWFVNHTTVVDVELAEYLLTQPEAQK